MTFGRTGLTVAPLCVGTSSWGPPRPGESPEQRDARIGGLADDFFANRLGTNFIDTSNIYGDNLSEGLIGAAIARAGGVPAGIVLQTKLDRDVSTGDFSATRMWRSLEESLARLGLERVEVMYLHDPENIGFGASMAPGGPVEALIAMKEQGLVGATGISGGPVAMLEEFVRTDLFDALITHNRFTLVDRSASALLDAATERSMGIANAAPFGAGVLTGDPRFSESYGYKPIRSEVRVAIQRMARLCETAGFPLAAAALQFSMRDPRIHSTVVGVSSRTRWVEAREWAATRIDDALWAELDDLAPIGLGLDNY